jgi:hypothetical protein
MLPQPTPTAIASAPKKMATTSLHRARAIFTILAVGALIFGRPAA